MNQSTLFSQIHAQSAYLWNGAGWFCYWLIFNIYCFAWREYAAPNVYSIADSNLWFIKEWIPWLVLAPFLIYYLRNTPRSFSLTIKILLGATVCLVLSVSARALLNTGEYADNGGAIAVIMLPKYASAYCIVVGCWLIKEGLTRPPSAVEAETPKKQSVYVDVEQRGLRAQLPSVDIFSLKAAGNYVEIATDAELYLKRITLAKLLQELPGNTFMRVHRSYAINVEKLQGLVNAENGAAIATLSNQQTVPVSKRYKPTLKHFQVMV